MREKLGVQKLAVRAMLLPFLGLILALIALELWRFSGHLWLAVPYEPRDSASFTQLTVYMGLRWCFLLGAALLTIWQCFTGTRIFGGKSDYTLHRLPQGEKSAVVQLTVVYSLFFLLLWAVQLALYLGMSLWYLGQVEEMPHGLHLVSQFYRESFAHSLLPLKDWSRWLQMLVWFGCLGFTSAMFGFYSRQRRFRVEPLLIFLVGAWGCTITIGDLGELPVSAIMLALAGEQAYGLWRDDHEVL